MLMSSISVRLSFTNYDCARNRFLTDRYIPQQWWSTLLSLEVVSVYSAHILPHSRIMRLMLGGQEWSMRIPSRTWVEGFLSWSEVLPSFIHQLRTEVPFPFHLDSNIVFLFQRNRPYIVFGPLSILEAPILFVFDCISCKEIANAVLWSNVILLRSQLRTNLPL